MFIVIIFGYKQQRIFTIDCLAASLVDCIWANCIKDITRLLATKEDQHTKEVQNLQKKIVRLEARIEQIDKQLEEELKKEGGGGGDDAANKAKKDDKKAPAAAKPGAAKKGKDQVQTSNNPLEQEKFDSERALEVSKAQIAKYEEKLQKIAAQKAKYENINHRDDYVIELLDRSGERRFVKTKLEAQANTFLSDKNTYILCQVYPSKSADDEDRIEICDVEGFSVRTCEEDEGAVDEPLVQIKKDDKKGAKKGGKK